MSRTAGLPGKLREVGRCPDSIQAELDSPLPLDGVDPAEYDLVFHPGGHGPMEDLAYDDASGELLTRVIHSGKPPALLCHAPAAPLAARAGAEP